MERARGSVAGKSGGTVRLTARSRVCAFVRARVRAFARVSAALVAAGCASPGTPPGGPPDNAAPAVVRVSPESGAVNVRASSVLFRFDEVVSEQPGAGASGGGNAAEAGLGGIVIVSPGDGRERVRWRRTGIEIEPRNGFRANTTYRVTLLPGLADLRGNVRRESLESTFSTGSAIPEGAITGAVFDWVAGRHAPLARVEAFLRADTAFRWMARADSLGRYALRDLTPGSYTVRAYLDANGNRRLDERESFDSLTVAVDTQQQSDFYAFVHDTIGPRIETVTAADSTALRIRFDRAVALTWMPDANSFVLQRADSSAVPLGEVMTAARFDSLAAVARVAADSAAADSAVVDSAVVDRAVAQRAVVADSADTLVARAPPLQRATPSREWAVRLTAPLAPGSYRLRATAVEGLAGARSKSEREFVVRAPTPPDTTGAPPRRDRP